MAIIIFCIKFKTKPENGGRYMSIERRKVVIIGAGHVGSHVGFSLVTQGVCEEIVYIDVDKDKAIAQAEDTMDATVYCPHHVDVKVGDYSDLDDADIAVMCAGPLPDLSKGEDRVGSMGTTLRCLGSIIEGIKGSKFDGIIISISNPADIIAAYLQYKTGYTEKKLISTSTTLDSARLRKTLARELNIDQKSIYAYALGEHGETQMVPWSCASIFGKPLFKLMEEYPDTYGKLDLDNGKEPTIILDSIAAFDTTAGSGVKKPEEPGPKRDILWLNATALSEEDFDELVAMLGNYEGETACAIKRGDKKFRLGGGVNYCRGLLAELSIWLDDADVKLV